MGNDLRALTGMDFTNVNRYRLGQYYKGKNSDGTDVIFKVVGRWAGHVTLKILLDKDTFPSGRYRIGMELTYHQGEVIPDCLHYKKLIDKRNILWEML